MYIWIYKPPHFHNFPCIGTCVFFYFSHRLWPVPPIFIFCVSNYFLPLLSFDIYAYIHTWNNTQTHIWYTHVLTYICAHVEMRSILVKKYLSRFSIFFLSFGWGSEMTGHWKCSVASIDGFFFSHFVATDHFCLR